MSAANSDTDDALELVQQAHRALDERDRELARLQAIADRLIELSPRPVIILDRRRIVRGWSASAERASGVPAPRAIGQAVSAVLPGFDLADALEGRCSFDLNGAALRATAESLDDEGDDVIVLLDPTR